MPMLIGGVPSGCYWWGPHGRGAAGAGCEVLRTFGHDVEAVDCHHRTQGLGPGPAAAESAEMRELKKCRASAKCRRAFSWTGLRA